MTTIPVALLFFAAVILGIIIGLQYLRGIRKPVLIGTHLLLGAGGLEQFVIMLQGTPSGEVISPGTFGRVAAGFFVAALASGLLAPMIGRGSRRTANIALIAHIGVGAVGFLLFLAWLAKA